MVYIFDIDGTLTAPREKISKKFENFFYNWMCKKQVFFVTGSDIQKVREQLSERILENCSGIFCCMGNELFIKDKKIYSNSVNFPDSLLKDLEEFKNKSHSPVFSGNHFEYRTGMLNFSIVGRNATKQQREEYYKWDLIHQERKNIANYLNARYNAYEACVGGQISIDIQMKGKNKSQAAKWIVDNTEQSVCFFGDKCERPGNDYDIVKFIVDNQCGSVYQVKNPEDLVLILNKI